MSLPRVVLKFGSSILRDLGSLDVLVDEVYRYRREGFAVIAVVSALAGETDELEHLASALTPRPNDGARATLLSAGETKAAALATLALDSAGIPAAALSIEELGLVTEGPRSDADPVSLDATRLQECLRRDQVAVVPGFLGRDAVGGPTLLGRGGSDSTAVFLAAELGARHTVLLKDHPGVFEWDPALGAGRPRRFRSLHFDEASRLSGGVIHRKALAIGKARGWGFRVSAPQSRHATRVGDEASTKEAPEPRRRPLRVGLAGLGTVGGAVMARLRRYGADFEIVGILVRRPEKHEETRTSPELVCEDGEDLLARGPDVVCELMGGRDDALDLMEKTLIGGGHVVTANKDLVAVEGERLRGLARSKGATFAFSAAVGGALPLVEWGRRLRGRVRRIEGVLNGTSNFVLDRLAAGASFSEALHEAHRRGFAEADARADTDGEDAARKLRILAAETFGRPLGEVSMEPIPRSGRHERLRQIACCEEKDGTLVGWVRLRRLEEDDPFLGLRDEQNRCVFELSDGSSVVLQGRGAGGRPTATAILGDLWAIRRGCAPLGDVGEPPSAPTSREEEARS